MPVNVHNSTFEQGLDQDPNFKQAFPAYQVAFSGKFLLKTVCNLLG